jgi:hypothetical protein
MVAISLSYAIGSTYDIVVGGTYRMELATGDVLEGVVESKNDSSLILESNGKPWEFNATLIVNYTILSWPLPPVQKSESSTTANEPRSFTYDELLPIGSAAGTIDVHIANGATYRGVVATIESQVLRLNIDGSIIPIDRSIITQISRANLYTSVTNSATPSSAVAEIPQGALDSVYTMNPETDEWGKDKPPILFTGTITSNTGEGISIKTVDGTIEAIQLAKIYRIIQHSEDSEKAKIKRYAKGLFCPKDMVLVDMPPSKPDKPFFKTCIDKYEYPNVAGTVPMGNVSFADAQRTCKTAGKRLCTVEEWQWACSGVEGYTYPYGWAMDKKICNTEGISKLEPSGNRFHCYGKFGVFDMVGNIFEWVADKDNAPMLMGGPYSKCQTASPGVGGEAKPQTGLRCCYSN